MLAEAEKSPETAFAKETVSLVSASKFEEVHARLAPNLKTDESTKGLAAVAEILPEAERADVKLVGYHIFRGPQASRVTAVLQYHYPPPDEKYFVVNTVVENTGGEFSVSGLRLNQIAGALDELNAFRLSGASVRHYIFLALVIIVPIFILAVLVLCIRTPIPKKKWMWVLFVLVGLGKFQFNWTTGDFAQSYGSIQLFGAGASTGGPYAPWILTFSIPIGAIVFLTRRRKWLTAAAAAPQVDESAPDAKPPSAFRPGEV